jgi:hypothetical protein
LSVGEQSRDRAFRAGSERDQAIAKSSQPIQRDVRIQLDGPVEVRGGHQLAEVGIALIILGKQREPVDRCAAADLRRPCDTQHGTDDRLHALGETGVAERHRRVKPVTIDQRDSREAEPRRALRDRLRLHRSFQHGEGGEDSERNERLIHGSTMESLAACGKQPPQVIHFLSRRPPAAFHDVADFPHSPDIGIGDAATVGAAIAIGEEPVARSPKQ